MWLHPTDTGVFEYESDDVIYLGVERTLHTIVTNNLDSYVEENFMLQEWHPQGDATELGFKISDTLKVTIDANGDMHVVNSDSVNTCV